MLESQTSMMNQLTQLLFGWPKKGKSLMVNPGDDSKDPVYPPSFAPTNTPAQPNAYPPRVSINISPQYQADVSALTHLPTSSGTGDNSATPGVPDPDDMAKIEKAKGELPMQLKDQYKWLEEEFKALESADYQCGIDANELSLVPDLVLPPKFKVPEFEKYNGTSCPEANIMMFCWRMTGHFNNDQLLIYCFQDSLTGAAAKWYNQLSRTQNMEKKSNESFRQYAQMWRKVATQVQPPLLEKETTILFINTLKAPFINHMLGSATKSFTDIVMFGKMIENAIRCKKIEVGKSTRRSAAKKRENEVGNMSEGYAKPITLYKSLFNAHVVSPVYLKPLQPPYSKWYDASTQCEYHAGIMGHSIDNCFSFKKLVERLIKIGIVKFDDALGVGNPLPNHTDNRVNAIIENAGKRIKLNVAEVRTPLREVWRRMVERGLIMQDVGSKSPKARNYYEFQEEEDHKIQSINAVFEEGLKKGNLAGIRPYEPRSVLNNWTAKEIPIVFRANTESLDIDIMSNAAMDSELPCERDMCLKGSQDFTDGGDCSLSPNLLRMVEREEKVILPHKETIENVILEEGKESYQDMPGSSIDVAVHHIPIKEECKPVQQKLRRMRPDVAVKIREEVKKQFDAGFLQVVNYSKWVANVVLVPRKDGKVWMCVDYRDLNKASPKDNFLLPHIDTLVDNTAVMPFGLKNAGAAYQRAMVTLFYDMMHKEIEVYVDDMIAKSRTEKEYVQVLRKLFLRLRKFQLKLNPTKCTFGARSGNMLGSVVSEKRIEVDPDKVKAVQELPSPRT
ncbi:protein NYNRIN-like [Gossypium australe]|uniref:Protein NYNRIN-like n=1 Tax=Gossypium australe TaxID=47621 RepID=A0A5B6W2Q3_9ROSI|nr:protein NYNRIN-like [Gossypium australe]